MIVVDEQLGGQLVRSALAAWYPGRIVTITSLRPSSVIKDEAIPTLLRRARQPTFVTINVADFWKVVAAHRGFCIVAVDVPLGRAREVPDLVRRLLRRPEFGAKAVRMGKVVRVSTRVVEYYGTDGQIRSVIWGEA